MNAIPPFTRILLPTDLGDGAQQGFALGLRLALGGRGTLDVVHVHGTAESPRWAKLPAAKDMLVRWGTLSPDADVQAFHHLGVTLDYTSMPALVFETPVLAHVARTGPELLILPTGARTGLKRLALPSFAEDIARRANVPAIFLPEGAPTLVDPESGIAHLETAMIPLGDTEDAYAALIVLQRLCDALGTSPTTVFFVHAGSASSQPPLPPAHLLPAARRRVLRYEGSPASAIQQAIRDQGADLVVLATRGHDSLWDRVAGSNTEKLIRHAGCPVLALPAPAPRA